MSHEVSETIRNEFGKWVNVYGRKTKKAGLPLPLMYEFERSEYDTEPEASAAADLRSKRFRGEGASAPQGQF